MMRKHWETNPVIASITLGQERYFHLKHKIEQGLEAQVNYWKPPAACFYERENQHCWYHQISQTTKGDHENGSTLPFRIIK